jgi:hypothetical protein
MLATPRKKANNRGDHPMLTHSMLRRFLFVLVALGVFAALASEGSSAASVFPSRVAEVETAF